MIFEHQIERALFVARCGPLASYCRRLLLSAYSAHEFRKGLHQCTADNRVEETFPEG